MRFSPLQLLCALGILGFVCCSLYARVRLPVASHPQSPGRAYRILHAYQYLRPAIRECPGCGYANTPTSLRCANPVDHSSSSDELTLPGEFFTREGPRLWGLRLLIGLIVLAAVASGQPLVISIPIAATLLWIVVPMMVCQREGAIAFVLVGLAAFVATAVARYVPHPALYAPSRVVGVPRVSGARVHLVHTSSMSTALWLNLLCAAAALVSVVLSVAGHRQNTDDNVYGPVKVFSLGVALSGLLLAAISVIQRLDGMAGVYLLVSVVAVGWLMSAFLVRVAIDCVGSAKPLPRNYLVAHRLRIPHRPGTLPPPARHDLSEQLAYAVERIIVSTTYTLTVVATQCLNLLVRVLSAVASALIRTVHWITLYLLNVVATTIKDVLISSPVLFRLATTGFRVAMFAPALLVGAGMLVSVCGSEAHLYLLGNGPAHMLWSALAFALATVSVCAAAALLVQWSVVPSFLAAVQEEYIAQAIIFFALFLDAYGLERLFVHASSHFGVVSWLLNGLLIAISVPGMVRRRVRASSAPAP